MGGDPTGQVRIESNIRYLLCKRIQGRLERDDPALRSDEPGQGQRVGPDIGSYVEYDVSFLDPLRVPTQSSNLKSPQRINRKVDSFL
jgi:hypothetical protein